MVGRSTDKYYDCVSFFLSALAGRSLPVFSIFTPALPYALPCFLLVFNICSPSGLLPTSYTYISHVLVRSLSLSPYLPALSRSA
jgi:hypothetical protein